MPLIPRLIALAALGGALASCYPSAGDNLPSFAQTGRNGVPYDVGRAECDRQAQSQTASIANQTERLKRQTELSNSCMRERGY